MEETIGYEALFSAEEWDSLSFGDWLDDSDPEGDYSENGPSAASPEYENQMHLGSEAFEISSGVATDGSGRAAQGQEVASEGSFEAPSHICSTRKRPLDDDSLENVIECESCDEVGSAETLEEAQAIARLHEAFVATLVARYEVA